MTFILSSSNKYVVSKATISVAFVIIMEKRFYDKMLCYIIGQEIQWLVTWDSTYIGVMTGVSGIIFQWQQHALWSHESTRPAKICAMFNLKYSLIYPFIHFFSWVKKSFEYKDQTSFPDVNLFIYSVYVWRAWGGGPHLTYNQSPLYKQDSGPRSWHVDNDAWLKKAPIVVNIRTYCTCTVTWCGWG